MAGELREMFQVIEVSLDEARARECGMRDEMGRLETAGMYPAVPTEQWQARNGSSNRYLYMLFRYSVVMGEYSGPGGKRKVYVGCKEERVLEARRLVENRVQWEAVRREMRVLERWVIVFRRDLERLVQRANTAPSDLGPSRAEISKRSSPKMIRKP